MPAAAKSILEKLEGGSVASYAIRFAAGFEGMVSILSGMSSIQQLEDNISYMKDFQHHQKGSDRRPWFFFLIFLFLSAMFGLVMSSLPLLR